jgi:lysozyme
MGSMQQRRERVRGLRVSILRSYLVASLAFAKSLFGVDGLGAIADTPPIGDSDPHKKVAQAQKFPVQGIDVSQWQGDIDWRQVRAAGIDFAYIKATEGGDHLDPKFHENWAGARRAGIPRGAYHFVYWCRPAHEQALWFLLNVPPDADALPPVIDVEWNAHSETCPKRVQPDKARKMIKILIAAMAVHTGKKPIIYTDRVFHAQVLQGKFKPHYFWLRSVAAEPHEIYPERSWLFWQFTTTGRVRGIAGKVDRNVFNGRAADWRLMLRQLQAAR